MSASGRQTPSETAARRRAFNLKLPAAARRAATVPPAPGHRDGARPSRWQRHAGTRHHGHGDHDRGTQNPAARGSGGLARRSQLGGPAALRPLARPSCRRSRRPTVTVRAVRPHGRDSHGHGHGHSAGPPRPSRVTVAASAATVGQGRQADSEPRRAGRPRGGPRAAAGSAWRRAVTDTLPPECHRHSCNIQVISNLNWGRGAAAGYRSHVCGGTGSLPASVSASGGCPAGGRRPG